MEDLGHSELFFTDYRDYWYNKDFLDLMAKRWDLGRCSTMLDIGCGLCHWSQLLASHLKPNSTVTAYDSDNKWAAGNEKLKVKFKSLQATLNFVKGDAHQLPFDNDSFDVVTCQTLLIHLENPKQALLEMKRVVRKGGIVICAEPNNLAESLIKDSVSKDETLDEKLENIKFSILWEQGKIKLKEGDNSFGDLLAVTMSEVGLISLQSYISDKVFFLHSPYSKAEQKATIESMKLWEKERKTFDDTGRKYFEVLGVEATKFYKDFMIKNNENKTIKQIEMSEYSSGGAAVMYLISGSK